MTWLSYLANAAFILIVLSLGVYVALEMRILRISRKTERRRLTELTEGGAAQPAAQDTSLDATATAPPGGAKPRVSVLLPIHNEAAVVERLIDAVCALRYPPEALEILVLDDSTDHTCAVARDRVERHERRGVNIRLLRRRDRSGFKAGNLMHGLKSATGAFFVIFDADFVPPQDFLLRCMPCFDDPRLGYLQTAIGYENSDASFLTRFQAMEMGHQQYLTAGLSEDGGMASLSGSSCIWRRTCVQALGGWNADTVTEDVDLGYRAQFDDWKYAYLGDVVSMSILPEAISTFRIQRERWGRGLIHSAFLHARKMARQRMPMLKRLHAVSMMFSSVLLASMYVLVLLGLPLNYLVNFDRIEVQVGAVTLFALVTLWSLGSTLGARRRTRPADRAGVAATLWYNYLYIAMFIPMAWYYFVGGIRAFLGVNGDFHRTPKGDVERGVALPPINRTLMVGEAFTFGYALVALVQAVRDGNYILLPLDVTACVGFGMVLYWSWQEARLRQRGQ
ncbi:MULTISPECIES: glycosyltransferase [unclassified Achromobacter]|uniref:glycosyltransferase n=1 Tax=unclassified Achromobacter TaxID=2626865 RepID=UPI001E40B2B6|nr:MULTISPECIES: glycosyltransferase [unclassified Achromobacter]